MNKTDRRAQRTQTLLMNALVDLSLNKGYDSITIRDLTESANIAYSTFFRHYRSKDDLLRELLHNVTQDFKSLIKGNPHPSANSEGYMIFQLVDKNRAFFRVLFSSQGTSAVIHDIQEEVVADVLAMHNFPADSPVPPEIQANHMISSIFALIRWWLEHDTPYTIERMGTIYTQLILANIFGNKQLS